MASNYLLLLRAGAIWRETHVVGTQGGHLDTYVEVSRLRDDEHGAALICSRMAGAVRGDVNVVIGPAGNAAFVAEGVAAALSARLERAVQVFLAERRENSGFHIPEKFRQYVSANYRSRILLVDDVLNTGSTLVDLADSVRLSLGGFEGPTIAGASVVCTHKRVKARHVQLPWIRAATRVSSRIWTPFDCMLFGPCSEGIPINTELGHPPGLEPVKAP